MYCITVVSIHPSIHPSLLAAVMVDGSRCYEESIPLPHYRDHASGSNDIEDVELWVEVTRQSTRGLAEALLRSGKADNVSSHIYCHHIEL